MFFKEEHTEIIEKYIFEEMTPAEKQAFETKLEMDEALRKEVYAHRSLLAVLKAQNAVKLKQEQKALFDKVMPRTEEYKETKIIRLNWSQRMLRVAAMLILLALPAILLIQYQNNTHNRLFTANFESYRGPITVRGEVVDIDEALNLYNQKSYEAAANQFEKMLEQSPEDTRVHFYLGMSYLSMNSPKIKEAIHHLSSQLQHDSFQEQTRWYLALAYLRDNNISSTISLLSFISKSEGSFKHHQAKELLQQLN